MLSTSVRRTVLGCNHHTPVTDAVGQCSPILRGEQMRMNNISITHKSAQTQYKTRIEQPQPQVDRHDIDALRLQFLLESTIRCYQQQDTHIDAFRLH